MTNLFPIRVVFPLLRHQPPPHPKRGASAVPPLFFLAPSRFSFLRFRGFPKLQPLLSSILRVYPTSFLLQKSLLVSLIVLLDCYATPEFTVPPVPPASFLSQSFSQRGPRLFFSLHSVFGTSSPPEVREKWSPDL